MAAPTAQDRQHRHQRAPEQCALDPEEREDQSAQCALHDAHHERALDGRDRHDGKAVKEAYLLAAGQRDGA